MARLRGLLPSDPMMKSLRNDRMNALKESSPT